MIPSYSNRTEIQLDVLAKVKEVYDFDSDMTDRMILLSIFDNFRSGGGLRLSRLGRDICQQNNLFEFHQIRVDKEKINSILLTSLDRVCEQPYYTDGKELFLCDGMVAAEIVIYGSDLDFFFSTRI